MKLEDILNEIDKTFGNSAFADPEQEPNIDGNSTHGRFLSLQGKSARDKEPNSKKEDEIYRALTSWVEGASTSSANALAKNVSALKKGKDLFPAIFTPEMKNGTPVYRGVNDVTPRMIKLLAKTTKREDWQKIKTVAENYYDWYMCTKPIKYTPSRNFQSWSYKLNSAREFATDGMLITRQDDNFYFSTKTMAILFGTNREKEILHYGKTFSQPVYMAIDSETLETIPWKKKREKLQKFDVMAAKLMRNKK